MTRAPDSASALPGAPPPALPVPPATGRLLVLATVFVCAACGLVYELELVALGSYLIGDSVTQASVVLSVMVFAMGVGSLLAKRLRIRAAVAFGGVEAVLALLGGLSAMALHACFAWFGQPRFVLVAYALAIGVLIGAEVPLLMTLIQRVRRQDPGGAVADLFAADYVGALAGGLAFPFVLLPWLGQLSSALITGAVNATAGCALVLYLFRHDLSRRARWALFAANATVLALLALAALLSAPFERAARDAVYGSEVRVAQTTDVQEIVLAAGEDGTVELYLDGQLRVDSADERRYHGALMRPALAAPDSRRRVLVLGGGDGLAAREALRHADVAEVTVVEMDPALSRLAAEDPRLSRLNEHAYGDPRLRVVHAEAFDWLRRSAPRERYDVIVSDLPGPRNTGSTKLYSQEFYGLAGRALADGGRLAVHAASWAGSGSESGAGAGGGAGAEAEDEAGAVAGPGSGDTAHSLWTVAATVRAAGLTPCTYEAGDSDDRWGFVLAARRPLALTLPPGAGLLAAPPEAADLTPSTLLHPRYTE
ncbi:polyamine aminopropyltransferase [Streptomyces sp. B8F3]|uniref:polyamine aminopropyltransferase n=1 Tax=Streptomyces sp. B8F3 TaxID=3153573 RepID=UPI00325CDE72